MHSEDSGAAVPSSRADGNRKMRAVPPLTASSVIQQGDSRMPYEWREHPKLQGRLHPQHPDDVQVIVHDGGPRMTDRRPEAVWVRIVASESDLVTGEVLNQPQQLTPVKRGVRVRFIVHDSGEHALMVRPKYRKERP